MVAHILCEWFVSQDESESSGRISIDGLLQFQSIERNQLLYWFRASLLDDCVMKLVINEPVIGHIEDRTILEKSCGVSSLS